MRNFHTYSHWKYSVTSQNKIFIIILSSFMVLGIPLNLVILVVGVHTRKFAPTSSFLLVNMSFYDTMTLFTAAIHIKKYYSLRKIFMIYHRDFANNNQKNCFNCIWSNGYRKIIKCLEWFHFKWFYGEKHMQGTLQR